jgi:hypothetical protein
MAASGSSRITLSAGRTQSMKPLQKKVVEKERNTDEYAA